MINSVKYSTKAFRWSSSSLRLCNFCENVKYSYLAENRRIGMSTLQHGDKLTINVCRHFRGPIWNLDKY